MVRLDGLRFAADSLEKSVADEMPYRLGLMALIREGLRLQALRQELEEGIAESMEEHTDRAMEESTESVCAPQPIVETAGAQIEYYEMVDDENTIGLTLTISSNLAHSFIFLDV